MGILTGERTGRTVFSKVEGCGFSHMVMVSSRTIGCCVGRIQKIPKRGQRFYFLFFFFFVGFLSGTVWVIEPGLTGVLSLFTTESSQLLLIGCLEEPFGSDLNPNL